MAFRVEISPQAFEDLDRISAYIRHRGSFESAERWFNGIMAARRRISACRQRKLQPGLSGAGPFVQRRISQHSLCRRRGTVDAARRAQRGAIAFRPDSRLRHPDRTQPIGVVYGLPIQPRCPKGTSERPCATKFAPEGSSHDAKPPVITIPT